VAGPSRIEALIAEGPVLLDGAWGTELQSRGLESGEMPDFWNLRHPERVEAVARAYVEAGSQVILTNTFRANRIALGQHPEAERIAELNRAGVEISRRAAQGRARVFASIGPCGKLLMMGEVDEQALRSAFGEQARALAAGGADAIVIETMSDLAEAKLAIEAARSTGLPVVACMVFDSGKNHERTMMGVTAPQAARELGEAGADVVGANCGTGIENYIAICSSLAAATERPIWIKPNAGLPELEGSEVVYRTTPEAFARNVCKLLEAGARFVGGCCGTNPRFIEAVRRELQGRQAGDPGERG
jgi:methionine synthase I (cobalamin-dependent)